MATKPITENERKFSRYGSSPRISGLWFGLVCHPNQRMTWFLNYSPIETNERSFGIQIGSEWEEEQADQAIAYADSIDRYMQEVKKSIIERHDYNRLIPRIKRWFYFKYLGFTLELEDLLNKVK